MIITYNVIYYIFVNLIILRKLIFNILLFNFDLSYLVSNFYYLLLLYIDYFSFHLTSKLYIHSLPYTYDKTPIFNNVYTNTPTTLYKIIQDCQHTSYITISPNVNIICPCTGFASKPCPHKLFISTRKPHKCNHYYNVSNSLL